MAKFTINNVELEFNIFDAENAEKYEAQVEKMRQVGEEAAKETSLSKTIRKQCGAIFEFIDALFGEGTSEKLFGGHTNLVDCANVYYKIIDEIKNDSSALPTLNREQRRRNKK